MITLEWRQLYTTLCSVSLFFLAFLIILPVYLHALNPERLYTVHWRHYYKNIRITSGATDLWNAFLPYYSDGLLPGVCAGAEAMGRPRDAVIALTMVNISHVTRLLLNSLFLCLRKHKARGSKILSKQTLQGQTVRASISSDTAAIS